MSESSAAAAPAMAGSTTAAMTMGTVPMDSAMAMLHGFCAAPSGGGAADGAASGGRRVELIVGGDAARRATSIAVTSTAVAGDELSAALTAGDDARAVCGGPVRALFIGGTAMYLGAPTLTVSSAGPVTLLVRTVQAQTLAGPVELRPGQRGVTLAWGDAAAAAGQPAPSSPAGAAR